MERGARLDSVDDAGKTVKMRLLSEIDARLDSDDDTDDGNRKLAMRVVENFAVVDSNLRRLESDPR